MSEKVVILAGGMGSRLAEETEVRPKPMVEIGGRPILWHIMKHYAHFGFNEFVVALGYKGEVIKRYFLDHYALSGNLTINLATGEMQQYNRDCDDWIVHLIDTGVETQTGGRVKRLAPLLGNSTFMLTYGDGVSDVDLGALLAFHRANGRLATITAVTPPARFGSLAIDGDLVAQFREKPPTGEGWINGGFMVLEPGVLDLIDGDGADLGADVLARLAERRELAAFQHRRFFQPMDTLREKRLLEALWNSGERPWKVWP